VGINAADEKDRSNRRRVPNSERATGDRRPRLGARTSAQNARQQLHQKGPDKQISIYSKFTTRSSSQLQHERMQRWPLLVGDALCKEIVAAWVIVRGEEKERQRRVPVDMARRGGRWDRGMLAGRDVRVEDGRSYAGHPQQPRQLVGALEECSIGVARVLLLALDDL